MTSRKVRVLVADDEAHIRAVLSRIVESLGGEVVAQAEDGERALALFIETRPDLVILDINMPKLTGNQALKRIHEIDPAVIAVMMTAQDSIEAVRECLELGARDYILKSNSAQEIHRLMGEAWGEYAGEILARAPA